MKTFIGTKIILAAPMTRAEYNEYRGWELPANENGADEGYLVEYTDGGKANDSRHAGYISWSPKEQFDKAYKQVQTVTRSFICANASDQPTHGRCQQGDANCNGYCHTQSIKSPATYEIMLFDFGQALRALKEGKRVSRLGWNGKGMWLKLVRNWNGDIGAMPENYQLLPWIGMKTADDGFVPWLASQTDVLAEDWSIAE